MKKLIALTLLLCTLALMFSSCGNEPAIEKPEDTNLEAWLFDKADEDNWTLIYSNDMRKEYLSSEYTEKADDGYVCYAIEKSVNGGTNKINCITITDPKVTVWGLNINSTHDEFCTALTSVGFEGKTWDEEFDFSLFKFKDNKRFYTVEIYYGSRIRIYYVNRNYVEEFLEEIGFYNLLTKIYIWLEEDVF